MGGAKRSRSTELAPPRLSLLVHAEPASLAEQERATLEAVAHPVFVLRAGGTLASGNRLAASWLASRLSNEPISPAAGDGAAERLERAITAWALSKRQAEVFRLVATGYSNLAISARLGISDRTVGVHVSAILLRANASTRTELVALVSRL